MEYDLTKESDIVKYMSLSTSEKDWNKKCDEVKKANNGDYPSFWFKAIVLSVVAAQTAMKWGRVN